MPVQLDAVEIRGDLSNIVARRANDLRMLASTQSNPHSILMRLLQLGLDEQPRRIDLR
jgi:hypothetical protein